MNKSSLYTEIALDHIKKIEKFLQKKTKKDFLKTDILQCGISYNLQKVKWLGRRLGLKISDIPWHSIGDLDIDLERRKMDTEIFWGLLQNDLPKLRQRFEVALKAAKIKEKSS